MRVNQLEYDRIVEGFIKAGEDLKFAKNHGQTSFTKLNPRSKAKKDLRGIQNTSHLV